MFREYWIYSAIAILLAVVAVSAWFFNSSKNSLPVQRDQPIETSSVAERYPVVIQKIEDSGATRFEAENGVLQGELEQLPATLRNRYRISSDEQPVDRLGVTLADVNWRPLFNYLDRSEYPPDYDDLKSQAENGDPNAAYFLGETLQYCERHGPPEMSASDFAEDLRMIHEDHQVPRYQNGNRQVVDIAHFEMSAEAAASIASANYEQCKNMPTGKRNEAKQWLDYAVSTGSRAAKSVLATEMANLGDPTLLNDMWKEGDPMALNSLAQFYTKEYEAGADPAGKVKSYAHWLAFRELHHASRSASGANMQSFFNGVEVESIIRQRQLLPSQVAEAKRLAKSILRSRQSGCCISLDVPKPEE